MELADMFLRFRGPVPHGRGQVAAFACLSLRVEECTDSKSDGNRSGQSDQVPD